MKKLLSISFLLFAFAFTLSAQDSTGITKFLGIPIDGFKSEMIQKLKAKGFTDAGSYSSADLVGEFNGQDVEISVVTNNNKVYRIAVFDRHYSSESDIKIRFNTLCRQFENNSKYYATKEDKTISDEEDISYEIRVKSKRYEAAFYQHRDGVIDPENINEYLLTKFTQEQIDNPTEEEAAQILDTKIEVASVALADLYSISDRSVWFMIHEEFGRYKILMFYDNELNRSNGEDL